MYANVKHKLKTSRKVSLLLESEVTDFLTYTGQINHLSSATMNNLVKEVKNQLNPIVRNLRSKGFNSNLLFQISATNFSTEVGNLAMLFIITKTTLKSSLEDSLLVYAP